VKYLLSLTLTLAPAGLQAKADQAILPKPRVEANQPLLKQILKNNPKLDKSFAAKLSLVIAAKSAKYKVPAKILSAILMQESSYQLDSINVSCGLLRFEDTQQSCIMTDFGIAQIHYKNLTRFNLDKVKLTTDLDYSVDAGAMILAQYIRYQKREPEMWWTRYNCGTGKLDTIKFVCLQYQKLVKSRM
jgi:Transglycosylase SLT domain